MQIGRKELFIPGYLLYEVLADCIFFVVYCVYVYREKKKLNHITKIFRTKVECKSYSFISNIIFRYAHL